MTQVAKESKAIEIKENIKVKRYSRRQGFRKVIIFISFILFPVTIYYLSPYLPIQGGQEGIVVGSLLVFTTMLITSIFLGRAFCGWVCPAGGLSDALASVKKKNRRINLKTSIIKWIIFVPWLTLVIIMPFLVGTRWTEVNFLFQTEDKYGISVSMFTKTGEFDGSIIIYYIIVLLVVILLLLVGKRSFCHHVCWMAPFMIIGRWIGNLLRIPSLRLKANKEICISCKRCDRACPMSINVEQLVLRGNMEYRECILCGSCIDVCPKNVISYSFRSYTKN